MEQQPGRQRSSELKVHNRCSRVYLSGRCHIDVSGVMVAAKPTHFPYREISSTAVRHFVQLNYNQ